jgi:hypothetical protein
MSKITFWNDGDNSVGIPPTSTEIDIGFIVDFKDKDVRDDIAQMFVEVFRELWDCGPIHHNWSDECFECGSLIVNSKCSNSGCYNSRE